MLMIVLLAGIVTSGSVATAQVRWGVDVHFGTPYYPPPPPPPPMYEPPPPPCPYDGGVWAPAAWRYDYGYHRYHWYPGQWERREFRRDDGEGHWHHDRGEHRGWERH
ncbi:MAG TPA: hypothetical protein VEW28_00160 [Candidatus Kapabacteria bacterium]|nr:hypothetical protein [Candidatus Kapabacteria bacterium]